MGAVAESILRGGKQRHWKQSNDIARWNKLDGQSKRSG